MFKYYKDSSYLIIIPREMWSPEFTSVVDKLIYPPYINTIELSIESDVETHYFFGIIIDGFLAYYVPRFKLCDYTFHDNMAQYLGFKPQ